MNMMKSSETQIDIRVGETGNFNRLRAPIPSLNLSDVLLIDKVMIGFWSTTISGGFPWLQPIHFPVIGKLPDCPNHFPFKGAEPSVNVGAYMVTLCGPDGIRPRDPVFDL
jgi:hypothetical protein